MISWSELVRRHVYQLKFVMALFNRATSKICLDWHQKTDFELNSNIHLRHSCNQNMQNIVTWGQNMSANIEEFACISMGGLFSGVPPSEITVTREYTTK